MQKRRSIMQIRFQNVIGTIRKLNGVCLAPPTGNRFAIQQFNEAYRKMNVAAVRLHDCPLNNPGMRLVDTAQIFGNWNADPENPDNYYFAQTDAHLKNCLDLGIPLLYRLGNSIEHGPVVYYARPPEDFTKWAKICERIIAHYTQGWANGFEWDLRYWAVWCEPNEPKLWNGGTPEDYFRLYITVSRCLKSLHPEIKIGGPAWGGCDLEQIESFLKACRAADAPVDFITWNQYTDSLQLLLDQPEAVRRLSEKYGFSDAELQIGEWHFMNRSFMATRAYDNASEIYLSNDGINGTESAVFAASALIGWQDTPLDMAFYYAGSNSAFGLFRWDRVPHKTYYAMEAFGELLRCPLRVETVSDTPDARLLAGIDGNGNALALLAVFRSCRIEHEIEFSGLNPAGITVQVLDYTHKLEPAVFVRDGNTLRLRQDGSSALYLIRFQGAL